MNQSEIFTKNMAYGVKFHSIFDSQYKTEYLSIYFSMPLNVVNASYATLSSRVLQRGSVAFPSMKALSNALDENYATSLGASTFKNGESEVFSINLVTVKDRYSLSGEKIFRRGVEILTDFILNPLVSDGGFLREYFDSEKQNLIDSINAKINNKASYSRSRFISHMCCDEAFATASDGDIETVKNADRCKVLEFYRQMIKSVPCDIFYVGEKNPEEVVDLITDLFGDREDADFPKTEVITEQRPLKRITETLDIAQGHLWIGFRTGITYSSPDYLPLVLFNMVLGGDVTGKMFMNLREKMSLCYTCHSSLDSVKGLLSAYAGIDSANAEKTEKAFFEQLDKIRTGDISDDEISDAKKSFANRMREIIDNPSLLATWHFIRLQSGALRDPASDAENIKQICREDIVRIANEIVPDTVYLLAGRGEKNEF